jgi:hypothetical protein
MNDYPPDWPEIALRIKQKHDWNCERCGVHHMSSPGFVLTVHHLDGNKANCADWNLAALCQRCHLRIQGRVKMDQGFFEAVMPVSEWFRPHLAGYLNSLKERPAPGPRCECAKPSETPGASPDVLSPPDHTPPAAQG